MARTRLAALLAVAPLLVGALKTTPFTCDEYEDDTTYTESVCSKYDTIACEYHCAANSTCDALCGSGNTSCSDGGGAVCAMKRLAHIDATCASVGSLAAHDGIPSRDAPGAAAADALAAEAARRRRRELGAAKMSDGGQGCDDHVYCSYCVGFASCEYLIEHASDFSRYDELSNSSTERERGTEREGQREG
jgi:hypothetical protein